MKSQDSTVVEGNQFDHVLVIKDPEGVKGIRLDDRFYKLGRSPQNDIVVRSQLVSRDHATLTGILVDPPLYQIFRLSDGTPAKGKSTNGMQINGERRDNWVLMDGDEIVFSSDSIACYRIEPEPPYANGKIDIFLDSLKKLAKNYLKSRNYTDAAEGTLQQILVLTQQFYGKMHPDVGDCLIDLAALHYSKNDFVNAESFFLQAIAIRKATLGDEHPEVAKVMLDLAAIYNAQSLHEKAESIFLPALAIKQKVLGDNHPEIAASLVNLASIYYSQKRYPEAKNLCERSLKIYKHCFGDNHDNTLAVSKKLANIRQQLRPKWLSWNVLLPISLLLLSGIMIYVTLNSKTDLICVKVLPDGTTKSISGSECRTLSK